MVVFKHTGDFKNTEKFLTNATKTNLRRVLEVYGVEGVRVLANATPVDSGETAGSWGYEINVSKGSYSISWTNANVNNGVSVAIVLQYGHATRNGGYVQGRDYINPAIRPIFDKMAEKAWEEVTRL
jgi:hypothetical protein